MVQLITTYRYDYTKPITDRYAYKQYTDNKQSGDSAQNCHCGKQNELQGTPTTMTEAKKTNLKMEWTGIAPMGRLVEPKILPAEADIKLGRSMNTTGQSKCFEVQPNRFLKTLQDCYPDLYERLKQMPDNDLKRRLNIERLKTTYQIDYCHVPEYPEGLYSKREKEEDKSEKKMTILKDDCEQFKENVNAALDANRIRSNDGKYQTSQNARKKCDVQPTIKDETKNWTIDKYIDKQQTVSEYMDQIGRTGCIIKKNKIHDHLKCGDGKNCAHVLKNICKSYQ